jgi:thiol-disulfide isomerase/thioredoxin
VSAIPAVDRPDDELRPDEIDGSFVPHARPDVAEVLVGRELVIGRLAPGTTFLETCALNESASIVWQCFDGTGTIDEIAADIADVFEVDVEAIRADVLGLTRDLGAVGFLFGVSEPAVEMADEPEGLPIGAALPDFDGHTEAGARWSSRTLRGRAAIVVAWSPTCGFCASIAGQLAELAPRLAGAGIEFVLLATGDARANRAVLNASGLTAQLVLQDDDRAEAFAGLGTPVAYLIDAEGRVTRPLALGSPAVVALARDALT